MEETIFGCIVAFLLLIVLAMQFQLNSISNNMDEKISMKLDELLAKIEKRKI
jgi:F0F1-type ATP synthase membrane subunit b/b'